MYKGKTVLTQNNIIIREPANPNTVKTVCAVILAVAGIGVNVIMVLCL